jgi:hypothetical protein
LGALLAGGPAHGAGGAWPAPVPPPLGITGTVGEYRSGHLHAGVDLSTGGKTGLPVRAVAPGEVVRVRVSGSGYGRALHVRGRDGTEVLYAHLERFAPALERFARAAQDSAGEYEADLWPGPGRFLVDAGDTIAWSGESGAGPPHLHLEWRDGEVALNPLGTALRAPDVRAPEVGPIGLRALAPGAFVDQGLSARAPEGRGAAVRVWGPVGVECRAVDATGTTTARLAPRSIELTLDGVPVFTRRFDRVDVGSGPAVRRVYGTLFDDDGPWSYRLHRWPAGAEPDASEAGDGTGVIDFSAVPLGRHALCVEVVDADGASAEAAWSVEVRPPLQVTDWRAAPDGAGGWMLGLRVGAPMDSSRLPLRLELEAPRGSAAGWSDAGVWLALGEGWFCARSPRSGAIRVVDGSGRPLLPPIRPGGAATGTDRPAVQVRTRVEEGMALVELLPSAQFPALPRVRARIGEATVPLVSRGASERGGWLYGMTLSAPAAGAVELIVELAGERTRRVLAVPELLAVQAVAPGSAVRCLGDRLTLPRAADSFYGGSVIEAAAGGAGDSLWGARFAGAGATSGGLRALAPIVSLGPAWWPLRAPLALRVPREALASPGDTASGRWGLYRWSPAGYWRWVGRESDAAGLGATVSELGTFAILEDRAAPDIAGALPADRARVGEAPGRLRVRIADTGSGFDPRNADIDLDGQPLLAVWDSDEGTLTARPARVAPGAHAWEVRVTDRAGNRSTARYRFEVAGR